MSGEESSGPALVSAMLLRPDACTALQLRAFEALVRKAFDGSDEALPERIRSARRLGFLHADDELVAIAGLKAPAATDRLDVFTRAASGHDARDFEQELGWVFVAPARRGTGLGEQLCRELLGCEPTSRTFATTRPDNEPMIHILLKLGFERTGRPYPHTRRDERLVLLVQHPVTNAKVPEPPID